MYVTTTKRGCSRRRHSRANHGGAASTMQAWSISRSVALAAVRLVNFVVFSIGLRRSRAVVVLGLAVHLTRCRCHASRPWRRASHRRLFSTAVTWRTQMFRRRGLLGCVPPSCTPSIIRCADCPCFACLRRSASRRSGDWSDDARTTVTSSVQDGLHRSSCTFGTFESCGIRFRDCVLFKCATLLAGSFCMPWRLCAGTFHSSSSNTRQTNSSCKRNALTHTKV